MKRTITALALTAGLLVPAAAQASVGCSTGHAQSLDLVHNLREHGTTCTMARNLANISLNGPNGFHPLIYTGTRIWKVSIKDNKPGTREPGGMKMEDPWGTETMRSGSSWITFSIWG